MLLGWTLQPPRLLTHIPFAVGPFSSVHGMKCLVVRWSFVCCAAGNSGEWAGHTLLLAPGYAPREEEGQADTAPARLFYVLLLLVRAGIQVPKQSG